MAAKKSKGTLVLLHGLGGSSEDWAEAAKLLAKDFTVHALDLPGSARGPRPGKGYEPEPLARWVLGEVGKKPVLLAGHSLGGRSSRACPKARSATPRATASPCTARDEPVSSRARSPRGRGPGAGKSST